MKAIIISLALASFLLFSSCGDDSSTNSSLTIYKYSGYDSTGNKIITGYLWIDSVDSTVLKGRWDFTPIGYPVNVGPQIGRGNFEGITMLGRMSFNLNPEMIDNNVILDGSTLRPRRFEGTWSYIGYPGEINWGRFEATQLY
jgi:hypothetical protein